MPKSVFTFIMALLCLVSSAPLLGGCEPGERVQLVLEARKPDAATDQWMEKAREILERRISALGSTGATVIRRDPGQIVVTLGNREDVEQAAHGGAAAPLALHLVVVQRLAVEEVEAQECAHALVERLLEYQRRRLRRRLVLLMGLFGHRAILRDR